MPAQEAFANYLDRLIQQAERADVVLQHFNTMPRSRIPAAWVAEIASCMGFEAELVVLGLILAKRAVDSGLRISYKCLYRLLTACFILADKFFSEQHHSLEAYSLLTFIPIKQLVKLEASLLELLEFRVTPDDQEIETLLRHELQGCDFSDFARQDP